MGRLGAFALAFVLLAGAPWLAHAQSATAAATIEKMARAGEHPDLRWPRFPFYRDELEALYTPGGWEPVWLSAGKPGPPAGAALRVLAAAGEHGLRPEDYDAARLATVAERLARRSGATAEELGRFDLALSVSMLRYLSDLHIGRVHPRHLKIGIDVEAKKLELGPYLRDAIAHDRIADAVDRAEPPFVQYHRLLDALARYRALAADSTIAPPPAGAFVSPGAPYAHVPELVGFLGATGDLPPTFAPITGNRYEGALVAGVQKFQRRHGLLDAGILGRNTLAAMRVPFAERVRQIERALERMRWLPLLQGTRFVVVNVPSFELAAFDSLTRDGVPTLRMRVVVGKAYESQTPLFEDELEYAIFRPYWVIPASILKKEIVPAVRKDPDYLARKNMELYAGDGNWSKALPSTAANRARIGRGVGVRERPGPRNALGLAKFIFPNDESIYLHGTPSTSLFARQRRDFSHGCIRLENVPAFAEWLLRPEGWDRARIDQAMNGPRPVKADLSRHVPVFLLYTTAVAYADGTVGFLDDVYGHDRELDAELAKGYPYAP